MRFSALMFTLVFALLCLSVAGTGTGATPHIVINEFESNSPGTDNGSSEWVELFNPTNQTFDLSGWTLTPTNGPLTPNVTISSASIGPLGYYVVNRTKELGANETSDHWLNDDWEIIVLKDNNGNVIDNTTASLLRDQFDDDRTWQRFPNGQETGSDGDWSFRAATKGFSNGGESVTTTTTSTTTSLTTVSTTSSTSVSTTTVMTATQTATIIHLAASAAEVGAGAGLGFAVIAIGAGLSAVGAGVAFAASRPEVFAYGDTYYCVKHGVPVLYGQGRPWCPVERRYLRP